jgi:lysophospholipase L1-like esterase
MESLLCNIGTVSFCLLAIGFILMTRKMIAYRSLLLNILSNSKVEAEIENNGAYGDDTIIFFGDSQVFFWPMRPCFGLMPIRNRGLGCDLSSNAVFRFDTDVIQRHPRTVVILIGTNDVAKSQASSVPDSIEAMVEAAGKNNIRVILCSILPVRGRHIRHHPLGTVQDLNEKLKSLSKKKGADYVDLNSVLSDEKGHLRPEYTDDGLHPNIAGYMAMTGTIYPVLKQATASSAPAIHSISRS